MIYAGASFLLAGSVMLIEASPNLLMSALSLAPGALLLLAASVLLLYAAVPFFIASIFLLVGSAVFFIAAILLAAGAVFFEVAASTICPWAGEFLGATVMLANAGMLLAVGAILLLVGATLFIAAAATLFVAGLLLMFLSGPIISAADLLLPAGEKFATIGAGFMAAGAGLYFGGMLMIAGLWVMRAATFEAAAVAGELENNLGPLLNVALLAERIAMPIYILGMAIRQGGMHLFFGALWLRAASDALAGPAITIASSLLLLSFAAFQFAVAMAGLEAALMVPLGVLLTAFAIESKSAAFELFETMDLILSRLETYSDKMSQNAARIAHAFRGILPTLPLGIIGLSLTQAQSFSNTRNGESADIFNDRSQKAEERHLQIQMKNRLDDIASKLQQLNETVRAVGGGNGAGGTMQTAVDEIVVLLRDNLPNMVRSQSSGLGHALSEWMG